MSKSIKIKMSSYTVYSSEISDSHGSKYEGNCLLAVVPCNMVELVAVTNHLYDGSSSSCN
jgi:hypothetical protein